MWIIYTFKTVHLKQLKGTQSSTLHLSIEGIRKRYLFCQLMNYYTLYSLPVLSLAESLQLILEISANFRLVSYVLADNWLISRMRAQCMISNKNSIQVPCEGVFVVIFFKTMSNKTIILFGFCDTLNNQGLGKCYQPRPSAQLITLTSTLIIPDITKTSSNNCLKWYLKG